MNFQNPFNENMKFCAHSGKAMSPFKENKNNSRHTLISFSLKIVDVLLQPFEFGHGLMSVLH